MGKARPSGPRANWVHRRSGRILFVTCANGDPNLTGLVFNHRNEMVQIPVFPGSSTLVNGACNSLQAAAVTRRLPRERQENCVAVLSRVFLAVFRVA